MQYLSITCISALKCQLHTFGTEMQYLSITIAAEMQYLSTTITAEMQYIRQLQLRLKFQQEHITIDAEMQYPFYILQKTNTSNYSSDIVQLLMLHSEPPLSPAACNES